MLINLFKLKLFIYVFLSMHLCEFNVYEFIKLKLYVLISAFYVYEFIELNYLFYKINRSYFSMIGKSNWIFQFLKYAQIAK